MFALLTGNIGKLCAARFPSLWWSTPYSLMTNDGRRGQRQEEEGGEGSMSFDWPRISYGFEHLSRAVDSYRIRALLVREGTQYTIAGVVSHAAIVPSFVMP